MPRHQLNVPIDSFALSFLRSSVSSPKTLSGRPMCMFSLSFSMQQSTPFGGNSFYRGKKGKMEIEKRVTEEKGKYEKVKRRKKKEKEGKRKRKKKEKKE